jgi:hypothetical protein
MCLSLCSVLYHRIWSYRKGTSFLIPLDFVCKNRPLEVYGHDGVASNVTMKPGASSITIPMLLAFSLWLVVVVVSPSFVSGDMVLYESHSVIHGRPFPLKGRFYSNVFIHFEPLGPLDPNKPDTYDPVQDLPPYLIPNSKWESHWRRAMPDGWKGVCVVPFSSLFVCSWGY